MGVVAKTVGKATSKAAKVVGGTIDDVTEKVARKAIDVGEGGIIKSSIKETGKEQLENLTKKKINKAGGIDNLIKDNKLKKDDVINIANDLGIKTKSRTTKDKATEMINEKMINEKVGNIAKESASEATEKVSSGIGKNSFVGGAVGAVSGAGIGGITGMATGADEDNQNGMIVTGALAGITGGAIVGGLFGNNITKIAGGIAKGASNEAVEGGAKGLLKNVGASAQDFTDKIDDIGGKVANKITNDHIAKNFGGYTLEEAKEVFRNDLIDDAVNKVSKKANTLGGVAQGAIMGSVGGAVIGGIGGGIDEDDTFIGGALKGGLIGGTLGGIGGGVSGYFNNNAKLFANTTANVNSLLGKK